MKAIILDKIYNAVQNKAKARGLFAQQSFLQLEALVPQGGGNVTFNLNNLTTARASEVRLNVNNAFVASELALYIKQESAVTPGAALLESYPNQTAFTAEATYVVLADLKSIFNSRLSVKVGDKTHCEAIDMSQSLIIPTTQQASASTFSERREKEGSFLLQPVITFEGQGNNILTLTIPANSQKIQASTAGATTGIYVVLKMWGHLVTGGSGLGQVNVI